MTPMMQQHREAKDRHPGALVFFRNGDFYELFHEDAEVGARLLGITLTRRDRDTPMAGVPHHALDRYLAKLLQAGHRVAICEQMEDPAQVRGRPVRREVIRVVTPGTLTEDNLLDPGRGTPLARVAPPRAGARGAAGVAWVELSTGQFYAADVPRDRLLDELARLAPSECLCSEDDLGSAAGASLMEQLRQVLPGLSVSGRPDWTFDPTTARAALFNHFGVSTLAGFGFDDEQPCSPPPGRRWLT